jgi:UDP-N-acetylglucosamine 2-epimerase
MAVPILLAVVGTRAEMLASASLIQVWRGSDPLRLPFQPRLLVTGQERTELDQVLDALGIEPDADLGVKTPQQTDAVVASRLLAQLEGALRHHAASAVVAVGSSATAWAAAVTAYLRRAPIVHLGAGVFELEGERPFPEYLHRRDLAWLADLHLCPDESCAEALRQETRTRGQIRVVGEGADDALAHALDRLPTLEGDPTLASLGRRGPTESAGSMRRGSRAGRETPRVLVFVRRREHHADALRPLCRALGSLSARFSGGEANGVREANGADGVGEVREPDSRTETQESGVEQSPSAVARAARHDFIVVFSLQSHICDALTALLPKRDNLLGISPLPHAAFVREVARARLVVTDSAGVAREAALLRRPLVVVGSYSPVRSRPAPAEGDWRLSEMNQESLESAIAGMLERPVPPPAPASIAPPRAGERAADSILAWWRTGSVGREGRVRLDARPD